MPRSFPDLPELAAIVRTAALAIPAPARGRFLEAVDRELTGQGELGPGLVSRMCAKIQRQFVAVPDAPPAVDGRR
jgi:hypothetical protein